MANPNQPHKADGSFAKSGDQSQPSKTNQSTGQSTGQGKTFANDPERARAEGSKGGKASHK